MQSFIKVDSDETKIDIDYPNQGVFLDPNKQGMSHF